MAPTDKEVSVEKENDALAKPKRKVSARVQAILDARANVPAKPRIEGDVVDLNDEDTKLDTATPEMQWYLNKVGTFKTPKHTGRTPPRVTNYKQLKEKLGKSLAEQRRRGMKERYEVYNADNEIYGAEKDDDEEDEEEEAVLSEEEEEGDAEDEHSEAAEDDKENDADVEDEAEEHETDQQAAPLDCDDEAAKDDLDSYSQFTIYAQRIPSPEPLSESEFGDTDEQDLGPENAPLEPTAESQGNDYVDDAPQSYDMWGADLGYAKEGEDFIALGTQDDEDAVPDDDLLMLCSANFPVKASEQLPADSSYGEIVSQTALKTTEEDGGWDDIVSQPQDLEREESGWEDLDSQAAESEAALNRCETRGFLSPTKQSREIDKGEETVLKTAHQESPNKAYLRQMYEDEEGTRDTFYAASDDEDAPNAPNGNTSFANTTNRLNFGDDSSDEEQETNGAANTIEPAATVEDLPGEPSSNEKALVDDQLDKNLAPTSVLRTQLDSDDEPDKDELPPRKRQHRIIESDDEDDDLAEHAKKRFKESEDDDASRAMAELSMEPQADKETVARAAGMRAALDDSSDDEDERPARSVPSLGPTDFTALDTDLFTVEDEVEENINVQYEEEQEEETETVVDDDDEASRESDKVDAKKLKDLFDDEASLSGDDVGSDNDEGDDNEDEYEAEAGDQDDLPEDEEIRNQLVKQFIRQQNNDDERRLMLLQEQFFADGDLAGPNMDRGFRFRLRDDEDIDWAKLLGELGDDGTDKVEDEDQELDPELHAKRVAMMKWKLEQAQKASEKSMPSLLEDDADNTLFDFAGKIVVEEPHTVTASASTSSKIRKDSMLMKASSLGIILKDGVPSGVQEKRSHGLFTAQSKKT
ncbi:Protein F25H5.5 a [Aphelenchoides avenae]|nr:Protein F25H5.5 a [Aphelenchus avenae]